MIFRGPRWTYEIKLDGYQRLGVSSGGSITLYSRRGNNLTSRYSDVAEALCHLPYENLIAS